MTKLNTKMSTTDKKVTKSPKKSYQIRVNITPELYNEIQKAKRNEFRFLDDAEIIKIFLSRGVSNKVDYSEISNEELMQIISHSFSLDEDWNNEPDIIDYSKAKSIDWSN